MTAKPRKPKLATHDQENADRIRPVVEELIRQIKVRRDGADNGAK